MSSTAAEALIALSLTLVHGTFQDLYLSAGTTYDRLWFLFTAAGLIVYAEGRDMAQEAVNSLEFFRNESCGKCVPCRLGAQKMVSLGENLLDGKISRARWSDELLPLVAEMGRAIELASICGLGRSVPVPLRTAINYFNDDVSKHLKQ